MKTIRNKTFKPLKITFSGGKVLHLGPVAATPIGAFSGAITNFTLGRRFTYKRTEVPAAGQAAPAADSVAPRPVPGFISAAGPPLHRPAAFRFTGAVTTNGLAAKQDCNMLLSLRDS